MLPDFKRADWIGEFWGYPESQAFAELLIDCEGGPEASGGARRGAAGSELSVPAIGRAGNPRRTASRGLTRRVSLATASLIPSAE
jgi:hypothetical protein